MNNLYFFCTSCKVFVDAGYRWAYNTLEEAGIVTSGTPEYWNPEPDERSKWLLEEVLPSVRIFFEQRRLHRIVLGEDGQFFDSDPDWFLKWIQEGFWSKPLPRFYLERVGCKSWREVCEHISQLKFKPGW